VGNAPKRQKQKGMTTPGTNETGGDCNFSALNNLQVQLAPVHQFLLQLILAISSNE
jgi:hypothetical protein